MSDSLHKLISFSFVSYNASNVDPIDLGVLMHSPILVISIGAVQNTEDVPDRVLRGCSTATLLGDADARRPSLPHLFSKLSYYNGSLSYRLQ